MAGSKNKADKKARDKIDKSISGKKSEFHSKKDTKIDYKINYREKQKIADDGVDGRETHDWVPQNYKIVKKVRGMYEIFFDYAPKSLFVLGLASLLVFLMLPPSLLSARIGLERVEQVPQDTYSCTAAFEKIQNVDLIDSRYGQIVIVNLKLTREWEWSGHSENKIPIEGFFLLYPDEYVREADENNQANQAQTEGRIYRAKLRPVEGKQLSLDMEQLNEVIHVGTNKFNPQGIRHIYFQQTSINKVDDKYSKYHLNKMEVVPIKKDKIDSQISFEIVYAGCN